MAKIKRHPYLPFRVGKDGTIWKRQWHGWEQVYGNLHEGYLTLSMIIDGKLKRLFFHHLVLETYKGLKPPGMQARHFPDRTKTNNHVDNLHWGTPKQNMEDKIIHGTNLRPDLQGEKHHWSTLTAKKVRKIRRLHRKGFKPKELAIRFNKSIRTIYSIVNYQTWKYV